MLDIFAIYSDTDLEGVLINGSNKYRHICGFVVSVLYYFDINDSLLRFAQKKENDKSSS